MLLENLIQSLEIILLWTFNNLLYSYFKFYPVCIAHYYIDKAGFLFLFIHCIPKMK